MKGGKQSRDYRKLAGGILRRVFSTLLWVACAGLFAPAMGQGSPQVFPSPTAAKMKAAHAPKASSQLVGFASLPTAAQSAISAAIGRDQSDYHARPTGNGGFRMLNSGGGLAAEFARSGVVVRAGAAGGAGWGLTLEEYGRGKSMNMVSSAAPQANANRVEYRRGGLTEWYVNSPLGIEQGFTLTKPPARADRLADQPLTIALALSGDLTASLDSSGGLTLKQGDGEAVLLYTGLTAQDATGRQLRCWIELRGSQLLLQIDDAGARYPIIVDPWVQAAKLTTSDGAAGDELGWSVAISGNTVVVGVYGFSSGLGQAFVFVKPTNGWATTSTFTSRLIVPNGYSNSAFGDEVGYSVAISEDGRTVVAGAPQTKIGSNSSQGTAWVFVEPTGGWVYENVIPTAQLIASNGKATDQFGTSVGISGNTIVVGAPDVTIGYEYQGAAYVFVEPTGGWASEPLSTGTTTTEGTQTAELTASDAWVLNYFGVSVGISGNTVVVGAHGATFGSNYSQGAAYVFVEPTNGWASEPTASPFGTQTAELTASDGATTGPAYFGHSVAISGNTVVVGAPEATFGSNVDQGAAYVFVEPTAAGGWASEPTTSPFGTQTAELTASNGASSNSFGWSVGINQNGDTVVVGAQGANSSQGGAAYVFAEPTAVGGWASAPSENETAELTASDGVAKVFFGLAVGISGTTAVVGAPGTNSGLGAAYVFTQGSYAQYSTPGPLIQFGNVNVNSTSTQRLTLTNPGSPAFTVSGISLSGTSSAFSISNVVCTGSGNSVSPPYTSMTVSLAQDDMCTITLQFAPTLVQNGQAEALSIFTSTANSNAAELPGGGGQAFNLVGQGVEPIATYSPTQVNFGNVVDNVPATQPVTVTNTGNGTLIIQLVLPSAIGTGFSDPQYTCSQSGSVSSPSYPITLNPNDSCTYTVQFDPTAPGLVQAGLGFADNAGVGESNLTSTSLGSSFLQTVSLSGTGVSSVLPPAVVGVNETITVTDTPSTPDVFDPEAITVTDKVTVTALPLTTTTLTSSNLNAYQNTSITFTAQVSTASGNPTGTVTFFDGETQLTCPTCSPNPAPLVTVAGTTTATYTTSSLSVGVHLLTAVYSGDSNFSGSLSFPPLVETISVPADFTLSAAPPSLIIQQGQSGSTTITITPVGNYNKPLSLSCPTLPSFASCVFTLLPTSTVVTSVTPDGTGTPVVVELTIYTTGPNGLLGMGGRPTVWRDLQNMRPGRIPPMLPAAALWLMGILALAVRQKNDKKLFGLLPLIVVLAGLGMLTACGFTAVRGATNSSVTPTGQSTAVVSVSGSTTHTLNLTVTITPAP